MKTKGFSIIEVMAALAIIGFVLSALASLQIILMRTTQKSTRRLEQLRHMILFMRESDIKVIIDAKPNPKLTKTIQEPDQKLSYFIKKIPKESQLSKLRDIVFVNVESTQSKSSTTQAAQTKDTLITLKYHKENKGKD